MVIGGSSRPQPRGAWPSKRARIGPPNASASGWRSAPSTSASSQPGRHQHVVVHERDQRRGRLAQAGVARRVEAAPLAVPDQAHAEALRDLRGRVG